MEFSQVGGSEEAFLAAKPLFLSMGKSTIYCGGAGSGSVSNMIIIGIGFISTLGCLYTVKKFTYILSSVSVIRQQKYATIWLWL
jgi:3-hydroxyisobutyrate dehydrogenase